ncbi:peptide ABC transporter substrate-binding protein [Candidatus Oscillochloris fontis]|uniref:peptide ABC transporter substrate-binding protein n=1 Tax=Candidatus Oscillochloris fontis TaxID=2496868 RepID=UPI00101B6879|nr:peptide ABC transporter substrate-binding protein [Candidatus Oscillochloris fontis]
MFVRSLRRSAAVVLMLALVVPLLAACGGAPAASPTAVPTDTGSAEPGVLRINVGSEPDNVDPQLASFVGEIQYIMMAYQGLMTFDQDMNPIPGAAESVEVSDDGLTYTFKIRPDSTYSDGTPLTAKNFEYAWKRLANPKTAGQYQSLPCGIIKGYSEWSAAACQGLSMTETMALDLATLEADYGVKAIDDSTLEIELTAPAPYFLSMAALWIGAPVREADVAKGDDWWYDAENYIGNGPFVLSEWDHGNKAVWEANPNYNGPLGPVKLKKVEYFMISEGQVAFQAYQNGELDMLGISPEDLAAVETDPVLSQEIVNVTGSCTFYFGFNTKKAPFEDTKVRQAFAQAFDREAWNRDIFGNMGSVAYSFIPPGFPGYEPDLNLWPFDPEAAKATLAESSYGSVENLPEIKLTYSASARNNARFEWVAAQLKTNLGIEAVLDPVDPTAYTALTKTDPPQLFNLGWCADYPDPQNWISLFQTDGLLSSRVGYSNPEFDALVRQADVEQDAAKRAELYAQAQEMLVIDAPVTFTRNDGGPVLVKPYVQGVSEETITPIDYWLGFFNLANVDVQP